MKEFVKKLIGRLEKQAEQYRRRGFEHEQKGYSAMADKYYGKQCSYLHSIEIVNELAEEYINCSADTSTTNADKIRSMTDEELAELFTKLAWNSEVQTTPLKYLAWLQSEVEGGADD